MNNLKKDKQPQADDSKAVTLVNARVRSFLILSIVLISTLSVLIFWPRQGKPTVAPSIVYPTVVPAQYIILPTEGQADAPVKIIEFGDFGCPTCRAFYHSGTIDKILVNFAGKVSFSWRDFPVITPDSPKAAEAGQCAYDQGKFWEYYNYLYGKSQDLSLNSLKTYAVTLGLDTTSFNRCLDSGQYHDLVQQSTQEGFKHGFTGTPSFLVNNKVIIGPMDYNTLANLINQQLNP